MAPPKSAVPVPGGSPPTCTQKAVALVRVTVETEPAGSEIEALALPPLMVPEVGGNRRPVVVLMLATTAVSPTGNALSSVAAVAVTAVVSSDTLPP